MVIWSHFIFFSGLFQHLTQAPLSVQDTICLQPFCIDFGCFWGHFGGLSGSVGVPEAMRGTKQDSTAAPMAPEGQMGALIGPGRGVPEPLSKK